MEAAYGLAITVTMIATSILFANYLIIHRTKSFLIYIYLAVYLTIELSFLYANMDKFPHGGYVTLFVGSLLFFVMYAWFRARRIKNRYLEFVRLDHYIPNIQELSNDKSVPKYATHLVYLTSANNPKEIEHKIIYSILNKKPKRADIYWFVHVNILTEPYKTQYKVTEIAKDDIYRIDFNLGFREPTKINLMFREVIRDMVKNGEVDITSRYESLNKNNIIGDFKFVLSEKFLSNDNDLRWHENIIMNSYFFIKKLSLSEERAFGLDSSSVKIEKFPMVLHAPENIGLTRIIK
jgi:KUP system potassium uptake protein